MNRDIVHFDCEINDVIVRAVGIFEYWFDDQTRAQ
jgi:hypothetical protein